MIPRGVLDVTWADLWFAWRASVEAEEATLRAAEAELERLWNPARPTLTCWTVRTAWELLLRTQAWPAGSEVLMSAVTIRDMADLVRRHAWIPIPIDVDPRTLSVDPAHVRQRITPRTKAIVVAQLFGSRSSLAELSVIAREAGVLLIEDAAQAFAGRNDRGDPAADVSFFSFGLIKAQTALGGALVECRDPALAERMRAAAEKFPRQTAAEFRRRIHRAAWLQGLAQHGVFTVVVNACRLIGLDYDQRLAQSLRSFHGDLLTKLSRRPSSGLLALLTRRLQRADTRWIERKTFLAETIRAELAPHVRLGDAAHFPSQWVLPIRVGDPARVCRSLAAAGFDATCHASNLTVIAPSPERPEIATPLAAKWAPQLVYLPLSPCLTERRAREMGRLVNRLAVVSDDASAKRR